MAAPRVAGLLNNVARVAVALGIGAASSMRLYTVDGGEQAVIFDRLRGVLDETVGEGTHVLIPLLQKPYIFDIRTRPRAISSVTGTKDLRCLPSIFKTLGVDYDERVLPSIGNEVLKAVVAQFNADQLLTDRPYVSALVREGLVKRAKISTSTGRRGHHPSLLRDGVRQSRRGQASRTAGGRAFQVRGGKGRAGAPRRDHPRRGRGERPRSSSPQATANAGFGLIELRRIEGCSRHRQHPLQEQEPGLSPRWKQHAAQHQSCRARQLGSPT
ncbi:hypothetical protein JRQ81_000019, partial [Phrynocephalus forsythii]